MKTNPPIPIIVICVLLHLQCKATNYYFSTTRGLDSRTILEAQRPLTPWKTIEKFNQIAPELQAGDTIFFKRGDTFYGNLIISANGSSNRPIVLSSFGTGSEPVIEGFSTITNWVKTPNEDGVYQSPPIELDRRLNMVVLNGINYAMGRYPNISATNKGYLYYESADAGNAITDNELSMDSTNWSGAEAVIRMRRWILDRIKITQQTGSTLYLNSNSDYTPQVGYGYFIQNHIKTLDQFGEWYYDPSTKRLHIYFGDQQPENYIVKVSTVNNLVEVKGSFVNLEGLNLSGANEYGIVNTTRGMQGLTVKDCKINFSGINGIYLTDGEDFTLESSEIRNTNNNGIYLVFRAPNAVIRDNLILNTGLQAGMGQDGDGNYIGLFCRSAGLLAEKNKIYNTGYTALYFYQSNVTISNNDINRFCIVKDDGGGIYTFDGSAPTFVNRRIIKNIVRSGVGAPEGSNNQQSSIAVGIYLDSRATNVEVSENTVKNCSRSGINLHDATRFYIQGNVLSGNGTQITLVYDEPLMTATRGTIKENFLLSNSTGQRSVSVKMRENAIHLIGDFFDNYYLRPLEKRESPAIYVEYLQANAARVNRYYTLRDWQAIFNNDKGSKLSPVTFRSYRVKNRTKANKTKQSNFNEDIGNLRCFGGVQSCSLSWEKNSKLSNGALKIVAPDQMNFAIRCGEIKSNKRYLLKFSIIGETPGSLSFYIREAFRPFTILSEIQTAKIDTRRTNYEFLFANPNDAAEASIHFNSGNPNQIFWIDNVTLHEVEARLNRPNDVILVADNPSLQEKVIDLRRGYIDVSRRRFNGIFKLPPFDAKIFFASDAPVK